MTVKKDKFLFVWDFHGTLEKGNVLAINKLVNIVLKESGLQRRITAEEARSWYGLSAFDYFRLALPEGNQTLWESMVEKLHSFKGWHIVKKHIRPTDFSEDVLAKIKQAGHQNIILSNTYQEHINRYVDLLGINSLVDAVIGVDSANNGKKRKIHSAKGKWLVDFLKDKEYDKVVMIGDKESDVLAGKQCKAVTYLFSDPGSSGGKINLSPDYVISDLRKVLKQI